MISIVTGTLNRGSLLPNLVKNTVDSDERLELVLVDGGSPQFDIDYIKNLNHPRIKLIEVGHRSSYPHFMNLGIKNASYEWVCQWNDDALLVNSWEEVINELDNEHDFYLFNWKYGNLENMIDENWLLGKDSSHPNKGWCINDNYEVNGEIVMNYGIYNKKIFREIGMYSYDYHYYYADGDMSRRAYLFGYKYKSLYDIKVCSIHTPKKAHLVNGEIDIYNRNHQLHKNKKLNNNIEFLQ